MVSAEYVAVLDVRMAAGRGFTADDHRPDALPTAVLDYEFCRSKYGEVQHTVGREIRIGDVTATVVGIAQQEFRGTDLSNPPDVYVPIGLTSQVNPIGFDWTGDESPMWVHIVARLHPGLPLAAANAALGTMGQDETDTRHQPVARSQFIDLRRAAIPPLLWDEFYTVVLMFGLAATAVLLIACLTVGTFLLVNGEVGRTDIAIRLALGASQRRLFFFY